MPIKRMERIEADLGVVSYVSWPSPEAISYLIESWEGVVKETGGS